MLSWHKVLVWELAGGEIFVLSSFKSFNRDFIKFFQKIIKFFKNMLKVRIKIIFFKVWRYLYKLIEVIWYLTYLKEKLNIFFIRVTFYIIELSKKILSDDSFKFALSLIIVILFIYVKLNYLNVPFFRYVNKYFILSILLYTLSSTFVFLRNSYKYGKYTSQVQRFWKRSYILFWLIEIFLFIFFSYLLLTHFTESTYFLDLRPLMYSVYILNNYWVLQTILIFIIIYVNYLCILFLKDNNYTSINLIFILINSISLILLYNEFYKFFYTVNYYYSNSKVLNVIFKKYLYMGYYGSDIIIKTRTMYHYLGLIIFLKFWHLIFIYFFYLFMCGKVEFREMSYDMLSSNLQNFIFFFFFNFMVFLFLFKNLVIFYFTEIYYWFFVGTNHKGLIYVLVEVLMLFK